MENVKWIPMEEELPAPDQMVVVHFTQTTELGEDKDIICADGHFVRFVYRRDQGNTRAWWIALPPFPTGANQP